MSNFRCMCGDPLCYSCGPAQGFHIHSSYCRGEDGNYECGEFQYGEEPEEGEIEKENE